jgi:hypothetical protein
MSIAAPARVFAAIEKPREASAIMPYGAVRFARAQGVNVEQWILTVVLHDREAVRPASAH